MLPEEQSESPVISPSNSDAGSAAPLLSNPSLDKTEDERMAVLALLSASLGRRSVSSGTPPPPPSGLESSSSIPISRPLLQTPLSAARQVVDDDPLSAAIAITCLATPRSDAGKPLATPPSSDLKAILHRRPSLTATHGFINTVSPLPNKQPLYQEESVASTTSSLSMSSSEDVVEPVKDDDDEEISALSAPKSPSSKRLTKPLPGGCHGRTSRYNSFCRRQPCFNGSNYCKLHYSLYIQSSKAQEAPASPAATDVPAFPLIVTKSTAHQDKRFTGSNGEIRCQATTTRGKACAYVAVGSPNPSSKYCHLHANFDTHPPARRNKAAMIASTTALMKKGNNVFVVGRKKGTKGAAAASAPSSSPSQAHANGESSGDDGSFRLLSMLSTDQWFHKRVIISTGPFMNRTGHVTRWGNGWVTVRLEDAEGESRSNRKRDQGKDGIAHNRRSFELFLHPDQGDGKGKSVDVVEKR